MGHCHCGNVCKCTVDYLPEMGFFDHLYCYGLAMPFGIRNPLEHAPARCFRLASCRRHYLHDRRCNLCPEAPRFQRASQKFRLPRNFSSLCYGRKYLPFHFYVFLHCLMISLKTMAVVCKVYIEAMVFRCFDCEICLSSLHFHEKLINLKW